MLYIGLFIKNTVPRIGNYDDDEMFVIMFQNDIILSRKEKK